jgi:TfoX/Sxy family transcriptional regulator of competence genes
LNRFYLVLRSLLMAKNLLSGILAVAMLGTVSQVQVSGQDILDDLYGQGVHSYYEGDYSASAQWLGQAIAQGTQDPRVYYFRGLAQLQMGHESQAKNDFAKGAEIETAGTERYYPIAESLSRVQGNARVSIEQARRAARSTAKERELARQKARYEETLRAEARVLRGAQPAAEAPGITIGGEVELPFPGVQADPQAMTDFSLLGKPVTQLPTLPAVDPPATAGADPSDPFGAPGSVDAGGAKPTTDDPSDPFGNPGNTAPAEDGKVSGSRVLGGLFRALGSTLPDPSAAAGLVPGGLPGVPGGAAGGLENFDPSQPETPAGDDPFGVGK